jgi:hypothetical protein
VVNGSKDEEWFLRAVSIRDAGDGHKIYSGVEPSRVVYRLGIPVEEELFTIRDAFRRVVGADEMQKLLPSQLTRRARPDETKIQ